jgi:hypothetical protein
MWAMSLVTWSPAIGSDAVVADRAVDEHRQVGGAGAHVHQHHAQLALVAGQHGDAGGQRGQDQVVDLQAAALLRTC